MRARRGVLVAALAIAIAAVMAAGATRSHAMGGVKTEEAEVMLTQFVLALNQRLSPRIDADKVAELFSVDGVQAYPYGDPPGLQQRGREAIAAFYRAQQEQWSAITHVESSRTVQEGRAVWEGAAVAVDKATGEQVRIPTVLVLMFGRDGKVTRARVYRDERILAQQSR